MLSCLSPFAICTVYWGLGSLWGLDSSASTAAAALLIGTYLTNGRFILITHTHIYTYIYIHIYMYLHHVCTVFSIHRCIYIHHVYTSQIYVCVYTCMYACIFACICIYIQLNHTYILYKHMNTSVV